MKNTEKNNKKIIIEEKNNPAEMAETVEIKRKRGRPKKTDNNNLIQLKNKKNKLNNIENPVSIENTGIPGNEKINKKSGKNKNNSVKNNNIIPVQDPDTVQVKHRGRPKGTKNTSIRADHDININSGSGDNAKIIRYTLALSSCDVPGDINDLQFVMDRIKHFYDVCIEYDIKPSVAALAKVFNINRTTLFNWLNGKTERIKNPECLNAIKNAYDNISVQYEFYMNTGKINPVAGIFLMKNNFGYKDNTEHVISVNQDNNVTDNDIYNRAALVE